MSAMESLRSRHNRQDQGGGADTGRQQLDQDQDLEVPCFLDIYVHDARNTHDICIYADQDVYAKFALTSAPDDTPALSTRVAAGGGASPRFDERLPPLRVARGRLGVDVLKCEVWMRGCAEPLLEDQLLGFALVPLAAVAAADGARVEQDLELSSTDLFHSPAGTVRLSLALYSGRLLPGDACPPPPERSAESSITSEVVILEPAARPVDYARIELPDLNVVKENHDMAAQYLPFLQLGEPRPMETMPVETSPRSDGEKPASSDGSKNASTTTTASVDDRAASSSCAKAAENPPPPPDAHESSTAPMSCRSPETPTSGDGKAGEQKGDVFTSPLGGIDMDAEVQSEMQRRVMEMYVKSMQQFSESLAKMDMAVDLARGDGVVVHKENEVKPQQGKNDGAARVFYGSRAFF